jgi:putative NIF3 family GTP cyclohydrolase 1 type 2
VNKQDHRALDETRRLIVDALADAAGGLTRTQICDAIQRRKTPHLIEIIEALVDEGYLIRTIKIFGNGVEGYLYRLAN